VEKSPIYILPSLYGTSLLEGAVEAWACEW
jgi:hypothetical protein